MSSMRSIRGQHLASVLAGLDDAAVVALLAGGEGVAMGIGGSTARVYVDGVAVFVKQLPLTLLEKSDLRSTANRFGLPVASHYGIASPGYGVGRELATHELTSGWVHDGTGEIFPLLLHWRVVDQKCRTDTSELEGPEVARRWGHDWPRVRDRLDALCEAESSVVLFLEHVPETLGTWLRQKLAADARTAGAAFTEALDQIITATAWMRAHGLQHLDVHPQNILMSEGQLLFTDFGLSMHESFELDDDERAFFSRHENYDHDAGVTSLLHWTLVELGIGPRADRLALLKAAAVDREAACLDPIRARLGSAADHLAKHAAAAVAITEMFDLLMIDASATSYDLQRSSTSEA